MLQSKAQHLMYYLEGAAAMNDGSYHIQGQPPALINFLQARTSRGYFGSNSETGESIH